MSYHKLIRQTDAAAVRRKASAWHTHARHARHADDTHTCAALELLMNWLPPLSGLVRPLQAQMVRRGSIFFLSKLGLAPDNLVHWWFTNVSIYESDHKQREEDAHCVFKGVHRNPSVTAQLLYPVVLQRAHKSLLWHERPATLSFLPFLDV